MTALGIGLSTAIGSPIGLQLAEIRFWARFGRLYPETEVARYLDETTIDLGADLTEGQALREVAEAVDVSDVMM